MRLPDDPNKYTSRFKFVEIGRIIEDYKSTGEPKFVREQNWKDGIGTPKLVPLYMLDQYTKQHDNLSIYRSVYQYDSPDFQVAVPLGPLYFDLDYEEDTHIALHDAADLVEELIEHIPSEAIDVYFSGGKGYHIEIEPLVLGISASDDLPKISSFIAHDLEEKCDIVSIDYQVYDIRRMWRVVNTRHRKTKLYKVECKEQVLARDFNKIVEIAQKPQKPRIKPEQVFNYRANQWYREYTYQYEHSLLPKYDSSELFSRFMEQGTGYVRNISDSAKKFDKYKLFKGCPTILELEEKAKTKHHLEHYERLFLCSLLTYTDEAIRYLHEILENCTDYRFEISNAHVEDWIKRREYGIGGRPFTCQKAREVGIMCSGCSKMEPKPKIIYTGDGKYIESTELAQPSPIRHTYSLLKGGELNE